MTCHFIRATRNRQDNMVSLGEDGRRSGGFFFDSTNAETDDLLSEPPTLGQQEEKSFRKMHSTPVIIIMLLFVVLQEACVFLLPLLCQHYHCNLPLPYYSVLAYIHAGLWLVFLLADRWLRRLHRIHRSSGYLEFYRKTRQVRRLPIMINSGGNALILILTVLLWDNCQTEQSVHHHSNTCSGMGISQTNYLQIIISLETGLMIAVLLTYLVRTVRFNRAALPPDVHQDDASSGFMQAHAHAGDVGFRDEAFLDDVLEKQADMIRYLKQHNAHLGKKIMHLTAELDRRTQ